jgi:hypothetical protein
LRRHFQLAIFDIANLDSRVQAIRIQRLQLNGLNERLVEQFLLAARPFPFDIFFFQPQRRQVSL